MGWTSSSNWETKRDLITNRTCTQTWGNTTDTIIAHCVRGNSLWKVHERNTDGAIRRYIGLDLLQKFDGEWGYKDMDESAHPYHYSCPLGYLEMAPEVSCQEWREEVKKHHARKKKA